ncbi:hypothetical protein C7M84_016796 [Penaeus vannamei]|uniref:Uncharacterized protein n=1 Tax=Penaeus vannamei TaxID=6689 RepID=A0A3R7PFX5_PENVA|nr:hypothetical protein C7M84_016796 [Penaeus vannamei]
MIRSLSPYPEDVNHRSTSCCSPDARTDHRQLTTRAPSSSGILAWHPEDKEKVAGGRRLSRSGPRRRPRTPSEDSKPHPFQKVVLVVLIPLPRTLRTIPPHRSSSYPFGGPSLPTGRPQNPFRDSKRSSSYPSEDHPFLHQNPSEDSKSQVVLIPLRRTIPSYRSSSEPFPRTLRTIPSHRSSSYPFGGPSLPTGRPHPFRGLSSLPTGRPHTLRRTLRTIPYHRSSSYPFEDSKNHPSHRSSSCPSEDSKNHPFLQVVLVPLPRTLRTILLTGRPRTPSEDSKNHPSSQVVLIPLRRTLSPIPPHRSSSSSSCPSEDSKNHPSSQVVLMPLPRTLRTIPSYRSSHTPSEDSKNPSSQVVLMPLRRTLRTIPPHRSSSYPFGGL